jgi:2-dehydropantoate 2-reductase
VSGHFPSCRVLVLGSGALGCLMAALLGRSGEAEVVIAGSWAEGLAAAGCAGVTVVGGDGGFVVPVSAVHRDDVEPGFDLVLVLVKSWQTEGVALAAARAAQGRGVVVSLQNGLGNVELLRRDGDANAVFAGTTTLGATLLGPARVRWAGGGGVTLPSALEGGLLPHLLVRAGVPVDLVTDIERHQWLKLAVNCAINPLSAVLGLRNGALLEDAEARRTLAAAAREVGAVAAARGTDLGCDPVGRAEAVARETPCNRSSMLQDIDRGRPTEIEALNGAVVEEGLRLGVATPANAWLASCIRELERQSRAHRASRARLLWETMEKAGAL